MEVGEGTLDGARSLFQIGATHVGRRTIKLGILIKY